MDGRTRVRARLGLTFALTELSFRLVERPIRDGSRDAAGSPTGGPTGPAGPRRRVGRGRCHRGVAVGRPSSAPASRPPSRSTSRPAVRRRLPARDRGALRRWRRSPPRGAVPSTVRRSEPGRARHRHPAAPACPGGSSSWATRRPAPWSSNAPLGLGSTLRARERRGRGLRPVRLAAASVTDRPTSAVRLRHLPGLGGQVGASARRSTPTSRSSSSGPGTCSTSRDVGSRARVRLDRARRRPPAQLQRGIVAVACAGRQVALLEVPVLRAPSTAAACRRCRSGAIDARTDHLNHLLRRSRRQRSRPRHVRRRTDSEWCGDHADRHRPRLPMGRRPLLPAGAKLVFETIARPSSPSRRRPAEPHRGSPRAVATRLPTGNLAPWPSSR